MNTTDPSGHGGNARHPLTAMSRQPARHRAWRGLARWCAVCAVVALAACAQGPQMNPAAPGGAAAVADWVFLGGKVVTVDGRDSIQQAVAVQGDRIVAVGSDAEVRAWAGANTRVVDLQGRTVIPGLIDSHIHAIRAALSYATEVHWFGARAPPPRSPSPGIG